MTSGIGRCEDGTVWWWGTLHDFIGHCAANTGADGEVFISLASETDGYAATPVELTSLETSPSPIKQISTSFNHYLILREDGTVSELGYIPSRDATGWGAHMCWIDPTPFYSRVPVAVSGLAP